MSVVVVGDANVDLEVRLPSADQPTLLANPTPRLFGGGSAANTAAALARLGVPCRFVGTVGDDGFGRFAVASLADAGVDVTAVETTSHGPTLTVIVVTPHDGERLIYVWPPSGAAHVALGVEAATSAITGAEWLHVSGICLRVSPSRQAVLAAMDQARANRIPVSLDLNLRLENWGWQDGFRDVVEKAVARADVVLGSAIDEIVPLTGIDDPIGAARSLTGGRRMVVARRGSAGAVVCFGDEVVSVPGFEVDVVDTVGAGDAFNSGFIAARLDGRPEAEAVRWGNAVAALTLTQAGARSSPGVEAVEALLAG